MYEYSDLGSMMNIRCAALTTCGITQEGYGVRLDLVDDEGKDVSVELSFEQAQAIAMTLPSLLTRALQALTGKKSSRYVFSLDHWAVEQSDDCAGLLLALATGDGFQVCFGVPAEACRGLGSVLAKSFDRSGNPDNQTDGEPSAVLN
jgi:hypothetical protein